MKTKKKLFFNFTLTSSCSKEDGVLTFSRSFCLERDSFAFLHSLGSVISKVGGHLQMQSSRHTSQKEFYLSFCLLMIPCSAISRSRHTANY